jgi:tyrosyl-tRNA synthetase
MDLETRMELIMRPPTEEVITLEELRMLLEVNEHPVAYDGFEPSGLAHLPLALLRPIKLKDLLEAGCKFHILFADMHAMINNKMGGDLEKIKKVGEYFLEVWKAAGIDLSKVEVVWASNLVADPDYWKLVIRVAKNVTIRRILRTLPIMGRVAGELEEAAQIIYPAMQVSDIFYMGVDICQLGLDQRRANILARELAPKLGFKKPIAVHHHMLMGLQGPSGFKGFEDDPRMNLQIASKMSKSIPETSIFAHDDEETVRDKIRRAYCPPRTTENNPILEYAKYIIFRKPGKLYIDRPNKYGGPIEYYSYEELEKDYVEGKLHPADLKKSVAEALNQLLKPIREHFEKDPHARELYEFVKSQEITR